MPVGSILLSVVATSVTITFFLSRLENKLSVFSEKVQGEFASVLLQLQFKDQNMDDMKDRLSKLENNFNQLVRFVNRMDGGNNSHAFTPRNTSNDDLQTFS
jgi:archaellum component FlaC